MPIDSEQFLSCYTQALNTFDGKSIAGFCLAPTVIMTDESKIVANSESELQQTFIDIFESFHRAGIRKFEPSLQQTIRLSDSLFFSKTRWVLYDEAGQRSFGFSASYTLQKLPNEELRIIVIVIDDEEKRMADIFNS